MKCYKTFKVGVLRWQEFTFVPVQMWTETNHLSKLFEDWFSTNKILISDNLSTDMIYCLSPISFSVFIKMQHCCNPTIYHYSVSNQNFEMKSIFGLLQKATLHKYPQSSKNVWTQYIFITIKKQKE